MMAAEGRTPLYLSPYIETRKNAYYASLKAAQQRLDWQEIAGFLADAIVGSADELLVTRSALTTLTEIWRTRRKFREGSTALASLDQLTHYPVLTIKRLADLLRVSFPAASQAVDQLLEAGILVERTGYERNRVFAAPEALTVINRPFAEAPILPDKKPSSA
jgi:Fic family protein